MDEKARLTLRYLGQVCDTLSTCVRSLKSVPSPPESHGSAHPRQRKKIDTVISTDAENVSEKI